MVSTVGRHPIARIQVKKAKEVDATHSLPFYDIEDMHESDRYQLRETWQELNLTASLCRSVPSQSRLFEGISKQQNVR